MKLGYHYFRGVKRRRPDRHHERWTSLHPTEWRYGMPIHVSRQTLNNPAWCERFYDGEIVEHDAELLAMVRRERRARRRIRMRLRARRGRGCAR